MAEPPARFVIWRDNGRIRIDLPDPPVLSLEEALGLAQQLTKMVVPSTTAETIAGATNRVRWTTAQDDELRRRYEARESTTQIAAAMGMRTAQIASRVNVLGIANRNPRVQERMRRRREQS